MVSRPPPCPPINRVPDSSDRPVSPDHPSGLLSRICRRIAAVFAPSPLAAADLVETRLLVRALGRLFSLAVLEADDADKAGYPLAAETLRQIALQIDAEREPRRKVVDGEDLR